MPFTASDLVPLLDTYNNNDRTTYTTAIVNFIPNRVYVLFVSGDSLNFSSTDAIAVPTSTGVTWTPSISKTKSTPEIGIAVTSFTAVVSSPISADILLTFPSIQDQAQWALIQVENAVLTGNGGDSIVQTGSASDSSANISVTLGAAITAGNLALSYIGTGTFRTYTPGTNEVALTGTNNQYAYGQYNILNDNVLDCTLSSATPSVIIGFELGFLAGVVDVTINSVNGGSPINDGDTGVVVLGSNFEATGATMVLSLVDDINDASAVSQTITSDGDTSMSFTVNLPTNASSENPVYMFITNATGTVNASGFAVNIDTGLVTGTFTVAFDDGVNPVICSSSDFALGMTAYMNKGAGNEEVAINTIELSNADSATPQLSITFSNAPVNGVDAITIDYDDTVGDIRSVTGQIALITQSFNGTVC